MNADIHGLSGAYAVDALDDVERAEFERHLAQCPECQAEVESLRAAAVELDPRDRDAPLPPAPRVGPGADQHRPPPAAGQPAPGCRGHD